MWYSSFDKKVRTLLEEARGVLISGIVKDVVNMIGSPRKIPILKSFTIDSSHGTVLIVPNRLIMMNLKKGAEVWAVGRWLSGTRFQAQALFFPEHQSQVDVFRMDYVFAVLPVVSLILMILGVLTSLAPFYSDFLMLPNTFAFGFLLLLISMCPFRFKWNPVPMTYNVQLWEYLKNIPQ